MKRGQAFLRKPFSCREIKACPAEGNKVYIIYGPKSDFINERHKISDNFRMIVVFRTASLG